jgi:hypothetical protein
MALAAELQPPPPQVSLRTSNRGCLRTATVNPCAAAALFGRLSSQRQTLTGKGWLA